ncbi:MAG: nucleotidyltransferase domain-containing protein, partial [Chthoniobacterales bacterium]
TMKYKIPFELSLIEREYGVRIVYAAEAGVRAWGFASPQSRHDVRFIYLPHTENKALADAQGFIEKVAGPGLTLRGFDLRRTLDLLFSSHAPLLDWLRSPVVYAEDARFTTRLRNLAGRFFDAERSFAQYLNSARQTQREYLKSGNPPLGKYLEAIRAVLAAKYIARLRIPPPVELTTLVDATVEDVMLRFAIGDLILRTRTGEKQNPADTASRNEVVQTFLAEELYRLENKPCEAPLAAGKITPLPFRYLQVA